MRGRRSREGKVMVLVFYQEEEGDEEERGGVRWRGGRKGPGALFRKMPLLLPFLFFIFLLYSSIAQSTKIASPISYFLF